MSPMTATGLALEAEFHIWGYSLWGANEFAAHIAEVQYFELLGKPSWDWKPRSGEVTYVDGEIVPEWWRLPYVVRQESERLGFGSRYD